MTQLQPYPPMIAAQRGDYWFTWEALAYELGQRPARYPVPMVLHERS